MIFIGTNLRLVNIDQYNIGLQVLKSKKNKKTNKEKEVWVIIGYYSNFEDALKGILNFTLKELTSENLSINQILEEIKDIKKHIKKLCKGEIIKWQN